MHKNEICAKITNPTIAVRDCKSRTEWLKMIKKKNSLFHDILALLEIKVVFKKNQK